MVDRTPNQDIQFPQEQEVTFNLPQNVAEAVLMLNNEMTNAESEIRNKIVQLRNEYDISKRLCNPEILGDNIQDQQLLEVLQAKMERILGDIDNFEKQKEVIRRLAKEYTEDVDALTADVGHLIEQQRDRTNEDNQRPFEIFNV